MTMHIFTIKPDYTPFLEKEYPNELVHWKQSINPAGLSWTFAQSGLRGWMIADPDTRINAGYIEVPTESMADEAAELFHCYGGITFSGKLDYLNILLGGDRNWIGFDCDHFGQMVPVDVDLIAQNFGLRHWRFILQQLLGLQEQILHQITLSNLPHTLT